MTRAEFLLARITDDERVARAVMTKDSIDAAAAAGGGNAWLPSGEIGTLPRGRHYASGDPARVLAECAAKRWIIKGFEPFSYLDDMFAPEILGALALPYADHPDFDEAWRP